MGLDISLAPDIIFRIGSFPVTNTLFWSFFISLFLILIFVLTGKKMKDVPSKLQNIIEKAMKILEEGNNYHPNKILLKYWLAEVMTL